MHIVNMGLSIKVTAQRMGDLWNCIKQLGNERGMHCDGDGKDPKMTFNIMMSFMDSPITFESCVITH